MYLAAISQLLFGAGLMFFLHKKTSWDRTKKGFTCSVIAVFFLFSGMITITIAPYV